MKLLVKVSGTIKPHSFETIVNAGDVFSVKHDRGEIKFKVAQLFEPIATILTNQPMCISDGIRINLTDTHKQFEWNTFDDFFVATPTLDYGVIVSIRRLKDN